MWLNGIRFFSKALNKLTSGKQNSGTESTNTWPEHSFSSYKKTHKQRRHKNTTQCYPRQHILDFPDTFFITGNFQPIIQDIYPPSRHNLVQADVLKLLSCQMRLHGTWKDQILLGKDRESTLVGKERALVMTRKASLELVPNNIQPLLSY